MSMIRSGTAKLAQAGSREFRMMFTRSESRWNFNRLHSGQQGKARLKKPVADNAIFNDWVTSI
jgi:hypothetical protein